MEWTVVSVIVVIVGLIGTVAVPLAKNTKAMTQLAKESIILFSEWSARKAPLVN